MKLYYTPIFIDLGTGYSCFDGMARQHFRQIGLQQHHMHSDMTRDIKYQMTKLNKMQRKI